jgi:hypothetical protein
MHKRRALAATLNTKRKKAARPKVVPPFSPEVKEYFRRMGALGGQARVARYSKAQLRKWAKLGGRPRKAKVN